MLRSDFLIGYPGYRIRKNDPRLAWASTSYPPPGLIKAARAAPALAIPRDYLTPLYHKIPRGTARAGRRAARETCMGTGQQRPGAGPGKKRDIVTFRRKPAKTGASYIIWIPRALVRAGHVDPGAEYEVYLKKKAQ
ncbi:MAG: hypothetical protein Q6353_020910 [Candidatus Sigynarchaeum springense]